MLIIEMVSLLCIYVAVAYSRLFSELPKLDKKHTYLHFSKAYLWLGLIGSVVFSAVAIFMLISDIETYMAIIFFIIANLFALLILGYYGYRVYYDDEKIKYRRFFGKYSIIYYKDITIVNAAYDIEIKAKNKTLIIPVYVVNRYELLTSLTEYVPKKTRINDLSETRVRSFSDSVYRKGEFIFAYILLYFLIIGLWILIIVFGGGISIFTMPVECSVLVILTVVAFSFPILSIFAAKRAHSSKFWNKVARLCFRDEYLKK